MIKHFAYWALLLSPSVVIAHSPVEGVNHFYNGIFHPAFVPAHLLLLLALGALMGQQGAQRSQSALRLFFVANLLGLAVAWFISGTVVELYLLCGAAICGSLIAADYSISNYSLSVSPFCQGLASEWTLHRSC
jgi:urease accessory protein